MTLPDWDARYRDHPEMWGRGPNATVEAELGDLPPGRALDLGCGDGRHARWLAAQGWQVVAVDGSQVAIDQLRAVAQDLPIDARVVDLTGEAWPQGPFDLVLLAYLHLPAAQLVGVHRRAASLVADQGIFLLVGHDRRNLVEGVGGPDDADVLTDPDAVTADLAGSGLTVDVATRIDRPVATEQGAATAIDTLVRAHR